MRKLLIVALLATLCQFATAAPELKIGRGVWIWQVEKCEGGDISKIVAKAEAAHLDHVFIKVTQGHFRGPRGHKKLVGFTWAGYNSECKVVKLAKRLKAKGVRVYAWGYHYPTLTGVQVKLTKRVLAMPCFDGFIYNVETEFAGQHLGAERVLKPVWEYRNRHYPDKLLAYSTYCRINRGMGALMPLEEFSRYTDLAGPQAYWADFHKNDKPSPQRVIETIDHQMFPAWIAQERKWQAEGKANLIRPIMPTGQAYRKTSNTERIPDFEVAQFFHEVRGYFCCNLYLWDKMGPEQWNVLIKGYQAWHPERNTLKRPPKLAKLAQAKGPAAKPVIKKAQPKRSLKAAPDEPAKKHRWLWWWWLLGSFLAVETVRSWFAVARKFPQARLLLLRLLYLVCYTVGQTLLDLWLLAGRLYGFTRRLVCWIRSLRKGQVPNTPASPAAR